MKIIFKIKRIAKRRYGINKNSLKMKDVINSKSKRIFSINRATKEQLGNIYNLLGADSLIAEDSVYIKDFYDYNYEFIQGDLLYEYHVFEYLQKSCVDDYVEFRKLGELGVSNKKRYRVEICGEDSLEIDSDPDILIYPNKNKNEKPIIVDAKWKVMQNGTDIVRNAKNDIFKLERDNVVHEGGSAILVFADIVGMKDEVKRKTISINYSDKKVFSFDVMKMTIFN